MRQETIGYGRVFFESKPDGDESFHIDPSSRDSFGPRNIVPASRMGAIGFDETEATQMRFTSEPTGNRFQTSRAFLAAKRWAIRGAADRLSDSKSLRAPNGLPLENLIFGIAV